MNEYHNEINAENVGNLDADKAVFSRRSPIATGGRGLVIKAITKNAGRIAEVGSSPLLTARQILDILKSENLLPSLVTAGIKSANGVGDALGYKHLDLPFILRGTKRLYLIEAAAWNEEQKKLFDAKTNEEQLGFVEKTMAEFLVCKNA